MPLHSPLQLEVLALYKKFLIVSRKNNLDQNLVKQLFRKDAGKVGRRDFEAIEYLVRKGEKQLLVLQKADGISKI